MTAIDVIGLDADDTLWHDERMFIDISTRFHRLLEQYLGPDVSRSEDSATATDSVADSVTDQPNQPASNRTAIETAIEHRERANLELFGYGVKAYTLSLIETAIASTEGRVTAYDIHQIIQWGKEMLAQPVELLDGVKEVVPQLAAEYRVIVITKGDLWNQEAKIARSRLEEHLDAVEVVAEKDTDTYRRVLKQHGIDPKRFVMAGNSLRSDIAPVLAIGARAVHISFPTVWALEQVPDGFLNPDDYTEIRTIRELPGVIEALAGEGSKKAINQG